MTMVRKLLRDDEFKVGDVVMMVGDPNEWLVYTNPSKIQYFLRNVKTGEYAPLDRHWVESDFVKVRSEWGKEYDED